VTVIKLQAQVSSAPFNLYRPLTSDVFTNLTVTSSTALGFDLFGNKENITDNVLTNPSTWTFTVAGSAWVEVKDNNATGSGIYPAGSYAGFVIGTASILDLASSITITTYLGNTLQDTYNGGSGLLSVSLLGGGLGKVGFVTSKEFDRVRINFSALGVGTRSVYYAEILRAQTPLATPACNITTALVQNTSPAIVSTGTTGIADVSLLGSIFSNIGNIVDGNTDNSGTITLPVLGVLSTGYISVREAGNTSHPAGYFAGFEIANTTALSLSLLANTSVSTYERGVFRESVPGSSLLVSAPLLSGTGRYTVGFKTSLSFDEIRYTLSQPANVNLGAIAVYNAVIKQYCNRATDFTCNVPTNLVSTVDPVFVNMVNTGVDGTIAVGNNISGLDNIIDADPNSAATISLAVSALSRGRIAVKNALTPYAAGTYVGFDVQTASLLNASVLGSAIIRLYNGTTEVQVTTGNALLVGAKSGLLGDNIRQTVGVVANGSFDQVQIEFTQPVGANLGNIQVFGVKIQKNCAGNVQCNTTNIIKTPEYGAIIENTRSGISGVACVSCAVTDAEKVIDNNAAATDFANIRITAGVAATGSIAVSVPANTFPAGTIAGFLIRNNNNALLYADLLSSIRVTTWNNGIQQETRSASELLNLQVIIPILGTTSGVYNVGFLTSLPYDEIQISTTTVVGALKDIDVFYATVDTRFLPAGTPGLSCSSFFTLPDINYGIINVPLTGNVATNDKKPAGAIYSNSGSANGADQTANPSGATLALNANGTYTHEATQTGVYTYETTLTDPASGMVKKENLTIIVGNATDVNLTPPIVNTDVATTKVNTAISYPVRNNDEVSTSGATLGLPTISVQPKHGTAVVNSDGTISYTPITGFVGRDTLTYNVCEQPGGSKCGSAYFITEVVLPNPGAVAAGDDFDKTKGEAISGNVISNDTDSEGGVLVVEQQSITNPTGTLTLATTGNYSYTPAPGYSGTAQFTYKVSRSTNAQLNSMGTLYVDVNEVAGVDLTANILVLPTQVTGTATLNARVTISTANALATNGTPVYVTIPKSPNYTMQTYNPSQTIVAGIPVQNADWTYLGENSLSYRFRLGGTNNKQTIAGQAATSFAVALLFNGNGATGSDNIIVTIFDASGGDANTLNNTDSDRINYAPSQNP